VDEVNALLAAASEEPAEAMREKFIELWPALAEPLARALNTRANQRLQTSRKLLRERCDAEVAGITSVLAELEVSIRKALDEVGQWEQPSLFQVDEGERQRLRTNTEALLARLDAIPGQREAEIAALRSRYADPTTRWFPVAVTLLVPATIAKQAERELAQGGTR
ncbi:MAG: hypothetical protein M3443_06015, partial [Actinomycetota bacterium]|nr:hypothetical protein [Actinomycetota bacterium]